ncbi:hypothetical protein Tco_0468555 [Tanacetum coccineum]
MGSKFMANDEECLNGWVGAGGGEVKGGGVDFGVSRTLLGEIFGEIIGESGGEVFKVDGGVAAKVSPVSRRHRQARVLWVFKLDGRSIYCLHDLDGVPLESRCGWEYSDGVFSACKTSPNEGLDVLFALSCEESIIHKLQIPTETSLRFGELTRKIWQHAKKF